MTHEFEGLAARIRHVRRALASREIREAPYAATVEPKSTDEVVAALATRLADLEALVQGFQDSVYRETQRQETRIAELESQIEPSTLAAALSRDARERGL